ncbi:hypothetical protein MIND_00963300 [Mycena indigotica]|uniref:DUF1212-domain-containing protein n=1 Tax=Mycena indigotica TaxID=2126181 RepID=A0A8H6VZ94_9AGAR|nr:uncharacterized protein MIND_00963300 [Mycena indigotica]KAF7297301.1 hypothetical protein MIND_00963300 [Mycena indigotica]
MSNGSSSPSSEPRPAGIMTSNETGINSTTTKTSSGAKTPRKVQWLDTRGAPEEDESQSMHALDEHANDPDAFRNLKTALERHSSKPKPPRIHYFPPRPAGLSRIDTNQPIVLDAPSYSAPTTGTTSPSDEGPSVPPSPNHTVPGTYIGPHENAGLPGTVDSEYHAQRAATKVVRAHTRKGFFDRFGVGRRKRKQKAKEEQTVERGHTRNGSISDAEQSFETIEAANPSLGGGVLSALLTLYNDQPRANSSASSTSGIELSHDLPWMSMETRPNTKKNTIGENSPLIQPSSSRQTTTTDSSADPLGRSHTRAGSTSSLAALKNILPISQKRNSAHAFGALIASTGNIAGVAAPVSTQLAPNIKRPGYHLSRYSLEEDLPGPVARPRPNAAEKISRERPLSLPPVAATDFALPPPVLRGSASVSSFGGESSLASKRGWTEKLRDMEAFAFGGRSGRTTPVQTPSTATDENPEWLDEKWTKEQDKKKRERKKRKKAEVYITRHVAQIIQRQEFILKLTRALMMFGAPSHRLQTQIQQTGRVLDIQVNCMYLPDVVLISFDDSSTGTSNLKFIRQGSSLNLAKLIEVYELYWSVIHDELSVSEASASLDTLMRRKQEYSWWQLVLTGGMCSAMICSVGFNGSFLDSLIVFPMGAFLVAIQLLSVRNELYSNVFEITIATLFSFIAAALAQSGKFCYSAVASSAVVLILPGFIVLCGSLEILSRNIISGSVRLCYAVVYSLFLGFGLAIGAEAYHKITGHEIVGSTDYACRINHRADGPWWQRTPSLHWAFLTVPMYSLFLSLRNHAPWRRREMALLVGIACIGWVTNHFSGLKFRNQNDITAAVGAFTVGVIANVWARFFSGNAFVIMITGILFQLPSGLGNGGLLNFVSETTAGSSSSYLSGFKTGLQLISVAIGLTVGLGLSLVLVHPIQSRRRGGAVFSL